MKSPFRYRQTAWCFFSLGAVSALLLTGTSSAVAAEQILVRYGRLERSLPVSSLRELAETGQAPPELQTYLSLAKQDPQILRERLIKPISVDVVTLDRWLNSFAGGVILDQISRYVHTPVNSANRRALRAALVLDASQDNQLTLLDTLENYPTSTVEVEGKKLLGIYRQMQTITAQLEILKPWFQDFNQTVSVRSKPSHP